MKKIIISLFVIGAAFGFVACNQGATTLAETSSTTTSETASTTAALQTTTIDSTVGDDVVLESNSQVFALEALSAANLLDSSTIALLSQPLAFTPLSVTTTETEDDQVIDSEQVDGVDQYLAMMEDFLGSNNGLSVTVEDSDLVDWQYKVVYTSVDLAGNSVEYTLYYNETIFNSETPDDTTTTTDVPVTTDNTTTTEVPVTTEPATTEPATTEPATTEPATTEITTEPLSGPVAGEHNFYFEDDDDNEVAYAITGIIISGDLQYNVEGKHLVEENGDEVMRLRAFIDQDNYVLVNYMTDSEDGTQKFFFRNVSDGVLVNSSKVRIYEDDNDVKVMLDITEGVARGRYIFSIVTEEDATYIHIFYNIINEDATIERGNVFIVATVDPDTGETVYDYRVLTPGLANEGKGLNQSQYQYHMEKRHQARGEKPDTQNNSQNSTNM